MRKFTKIMLILSGVFGAIGVVCMVIAFALGLTTSGLWKMIENGEFSFDSSDIHISGSQNSITEMKIYEDCENMEIEFGAGLLEIYYADVEEIQVKCENLSNIKAEVKNGTLQIKKKGTISLSLNNNTERKLTVVLPKDTEFKKVELEVGAGKADVLGLHTQKLDIEVGTGQVNVELNGVQNEYNYQIECGVGTVVIGETSYTGLGADHKVKNEGATKEMLIDCGVGNVQITFTE